MSPGHLDSTSDAIVKFCYVSRAERHLESSVRHITSVPRDALRVLWSSDDECFIRILSDSIQVHVPRANISQFVALLNSSLCHGHSDEVGDCRGKNWAARAVQTP